MLDSISDISQISAKSCRATPYWAVLSMNKKNCIFPLSPPLLLLLLRERRQRLGWAGPTILSQLILSRTSYISHHSSYKVERNITKKQTAAWKLRYFPIMSCFRQPESWSSHLEQRSLSGFLYSQPALSVEEKTDDFYKLDMARAFVIVSNDCHYWVWSGDTWHGVTPGKTAATGYEDWEGRTEN